MHSGASGVARRCMSRRVFCRFCHARSRVPIVLGPFHYCAFCERAEPDAPETIDDQRRCTRCRYRTIYGGSRGSASLPAPAKLARRLLRKEPSSPKACRVFAERVVKRSLFLTMTFGFLGYGKMASALVQGMLQADACKPEHILVINRHPETIKDEVQQYGL